MPAESRRYKVNVSYPNFSELGTPYFDETCITEDLTMTLEELEHHRFQEKKGFLKINSVEPIFPTLTHSTKS